MRLFSQLMANGVTVGMLYALFAYGLSMILSVTRTFHFAHGLTLVASAYGFWWAATASGLNLLLAIALALVVGALVGVGSEVLVYAPLRRHGAGEILQLVAAISLLTFGQSTLAIIFGPAPKVAPPRAGLDYNLLIGGVVISAWNIAVMAASAIVFLLLFVLLTRTRIGLSLRAVGDNPQQARVIGIPISRVYIVVFALGSIVAAVPGILLTAHQPITTTMGFSILVKGIVVLIIGGIGNMPGALVGGLLIGLTEGLIQFTFSSHWAEFGVFVLLFVFVYFRPHGLSTAATAAH